MTLITVRVLSDPVESPPLTTLLSWAWIAFVVEADNAFEASCSHWARRPFRISFAMWANGLRNIGEGGVTVRELRAANRASCNLAGLERWGWIVVGDAAGAGAGGSGSRRAGYGSHRGITDSTSVRPTRAGSYARRVWPEILGRVEEAWVERFGSAALLAIRTAIDGLAEAMPWAPPEVHPSGGFWTHVYDGGRDSSDPPEDENVPLPALLGQALARLTLDHETASRTSLALAANGLRLLGDGPARIRDLPVRSGISKEAVAMVTGYLARRRLAQVTPGRTIALTASGVDALEDYERRVTKRTHANLGSTLQEVLGRSEALASGLVPLPGGWRGEPPYLTQTTRVLSDPTASLPWQPMVLHRGGWPDGS